ncbi:MAG: hypothetical protein U0003_02055 [Vampirovibrionales bacterium]
MRVIPVKLTFLGSQKADAIAQALIKGQSVQDWYQELNQSNIQAALRRAGREDLAKTLFITPSTNRYDSRFTVTVNSKP